MTAESADVVVCGAGVGGLAAACALGARGLRVLLLEKRPKPVPVAKGEVLQPSSIQILREWGVLPRLEERGAVPLDRLVIREADGRRVMVFDYAALAGQRHLLSHDHGEILGALADSLGDGVRWRRGALVRDLLRDGSGRICGVVVDEDGRGVEVRAPLVVAADGLSSRLRRLAGISAEPVEYPHRLASFELTGGPELPAEVSSYLTDRGLRLLYPLPGGRIRLYVQVGADELRGVRKDDLASWCDGVVAGTPALKPLLGVLRDSFGTRQLLKLWRFTADRMAVPGLAMVGEAAHAVHPMAAQGMNTAIADAHTLAGLLGGQSTVDTALDRYQRARAGWVRHIDRMSHDATRMITDTSWAGRLIGRRMLRRTSRNARLRFVATYNMAGLGIRPFTVLDRMHQLGLPDPRAGRIPAWT
ncbi:NAD(P)/FAD-dependent oxidoreductase [Saccharopolyspora thermophila]|uniref:2-octaprenyl-3-methyl-6-methoxy-1,4-benzoquinol hydroxylase n=1 Tax=Saccharopolyspora thermophila TaxID=89367 RepID=A0ABP3LSG1_9PSEU